MGCAPTRNDVSAAMSRGSVTAGEGIEAPDFGRRQNAGSLAADVGVVVIGVFALSWAPWPPKVKVVNPHRLKHRVMCCCPQYIVFQSGWHN